MTSPRLSRIPVAHTSHLSHNSFDLTSSGRSLTSPFNLLSNVYGVGSGNPNGSESYEGNDNFKNHAGDTLSKLNDINNSIKVICRFRPSNEFEISKGDNIVSFPDAKSVFVSGKEAPATFTFDRVFPPSSTQRDIYDFSISQTVDDLLNGYNGTVLAYGQTGSGKSFTMLGPSIQDEVNRGVIPRISQEIFERIENGSQDVEYTVGIQFMEIHMEQIKDLLDAYSFNTEQKFSIHEDRTKGIYVKGLSQAFVSSAKELVNILNQGLACRASVSTNMNLESSRSHAILQINLTQKHILSQIMKRSHLFLVDLAGSEKVDKTGAQGQLLEEAKKINSSLSSLGNVINSLTDGKSTHIPYRDSKLTRILQESLGGNSRTSLIINCSPSSFNELETLSTLRFGTRANGIRNTAHINTELSSTALRVKISQLEKTNETNKSYIKELEHELNQWRNSEITERSDRSSIQSLPGFQASHKPGISSSTTIANHNSLRSSITPRTPQKEFTSRLPMAASSSPLLPQKSQLQMNEELERRDQKIEHLENTILSMKMDKLRSNHSEESKLFHLENTLQKLNNKLDDVELVNNNLRKHLLISEKIIESRDIKINKLKGSLKEQQMLISRETVGFRSKLGDIQTKLDMLNKDNQQELLHQARESLIRESIYSSDGNRTHDSLFNNDNVTRETLSEDGSKSLIIQSDHSFAKEPVSSETIDIRNLLGSQGLKVEEGYKAMIEKIENSTESESRPATIVGTNHLAAKENFDAIDSTSAETKSSHHNFTPLISQTEQGQNINEIVIPSHKTIQFQDDTIKIKQLQRVKKPTRHVEELPECDLEEFNPLIVEEEEEGKQEAKQEVGDMKMRRISLIESKKPHIDSKPSFTNQDNSILNFHQEYLSIGEFLAESKRKTQSLKPRKSIREEESSDTSGMFDSPPSSPKQGLNLKIIKPMRGGSKNTEGFTNPVSFFH